MTLFMYSGVFLQFCKHEWSMKRHYWEASRSFRNFIFTPQAAIFGLNCPPVKFDKVRSVGTSNQVYYLTIVCVNIDGLVSCFFRNFPLPRVSHYLKYYVNSWYFLVRTIERMQELQNRRLYDLCVPFFSHFCPGYCRDCNLKKHRIVKIGYFWFSEFRSPFAKVSGLFLTSDPLVFYWSNRFQFFLFHFRQAGYSIVGFHNYCNWLRVIESLFLPLLAILNRFWNVVF